LSRSASQRVVIVGEAAIRRGLTQPAESSAAGNEGSAPDCESRGGRDHGCGTFVDGVDDLGVIDPAQVSRRDPEIGTPELSLDDQERNPFTGHLHRVRMPQFVRREATANPAASAAARSWPRTPAGAHGRPRVGPRSTQNNALTGNVRRSSSHGSRRSQAHRSIPTSRRLPPSQHGQNRATLHVQVALAERERFADPQSSAPSTTITARSRTPSGPSPAARITAMISSTVGGSGGCRRPLLRGERPS
jgi:hypothetical protein